MNATQFCKRERIRCRSSMVDENPNCPDWTDADHYRVVLRHGTRRLTVYYSMGYAHCREPEAGEVLDYIASDSCGIDNASSFEDWCGELGFDTDSRKAERIFKVSQRQAEKLKRFLGADLLHELTYDVERL